MPLNSNEEKKEVVTEQPALSTSSQTQRKRVYKVTFQLKPNVNRSNISIGEIANQLRGTVKKALPLSPGESLHACHVDYDLKTYSITLAITLKNPSSEFTAVSELFNKINEHASKIGMLSSYIPSSHTKETPLMQDKLVTDAKAPQTMFYSQQRLQCHEVKSDSSNVELNNNKRRRLGPSLRSG